MSNPGSVLVVCTGNVCRSPYIELRLRHELGGTGIEVSSAGTHALVGRSVEGGTREQLQHRGIEATDFMARQLTPELLSRADLVLTAAREHRAIAARLLPATLSRTLTLRDLGDLLSGLTAQEVQEIGGSGSWVRQVVDAASRRRSQVAARQEGIDITDPIGGPPSRFAQMAAEVEDALAPVVRALRAVPARPTG